MTNQENQFALVTSQRGAFIMLGKLFNNKRLQLDYLTQYKAQMTEVGLLTFRFPQSQFNEVLLASQIADEDLVDERLVLSPTTTEPSYMRLTQHERLMTGRKLEEWELYRSGRLMRGGLLTPTGLLVKFSHEEYLHASQVYVALRAWECENK